MNENLIEYAKRITSQCGEDGIIEEIFRRIGTTNKWCIEFGAWDGKLLSNTWSLWHNEGWNALLIEADNSRLSQLKENYKSLKNVIPYNCFVNSEGENSLDEIFKKFELPGEPDLISIDVDSEDYYIFKGMKNYKPRVVIIEYNSTIPPHIDIVQEPNQMLGASALAMNNLAESKGYTLVAITQSNCIFVSNNDFPKLGIPKRSIRELFPYEILTYVMSSFDGWLFLNNRPVYYNIPRSFFSLEHLKIVYKKIFKGIKLPCKLSKLYRFVKLFHL